jgi:hypothetical protein
MFFDYRSFYSDIIDRKTKLLENRTVDSFDSLPISRIPYGFVVYPDGEFGTVDDWGGHEDVAGGKGEMEKILNSGGLRIAKSDYGEGGEYNAEYLPNKATNKAKKTAKDLAALYQKPINFSTAKWMTYPFNESEITEEYPATWNKEEFEKIQSFAGKLKYAATHLPKIASGSGRAVFKIDDTKVLKIAKNKKGLAQNNVESEYLLQKYDITARTFDRGDDVKNIGPFWIEMELAKKVGKKRFEELTGITLSELHTHLLYNTTRRKYNVAPPRTPEDASYLEKIQNNDFVIDLTGLMADYDFPDIGDMTRLSTYGEVIRDGAPKIVLVDFGLTNTVLDDFYRVKL